MTDDQPRDEPVPAPRRRRAAWIAPLVVILVIANVVFFLVVRGGGPDLGSTFRATQMIPYSIDYPSTWKQFPGSTDTVLSPKDIRQNDAARAEATSDPVHFTGVFLEPLAPQATTTIGSLQGSVVSQSLKSIDGRTADRWDLRKDVLSGVAIEFLVYRIHVDATDAYLLVFFGAGQGFDAPTFDAVAGTLRFDDAKLRSAISNAPPIAVPSPAVSP